MSRRATCPKKVNRYIFLKFFYIGYHYAARDGLELIMYCLGKKKQKYQQNIRESIEIKTQSIQSHMRPGKPIGLALLTLVTGPPWHLQADVLMAQTLHPAQN